uniref:Uncharacterized protein n=1 Tax=Romanomermis culicivorax TaxID=13658 RepID=A0A915J9C0_ROMCU
MHRIDNNAIINAKKYDKLINPRVHVDMRSALSQKYVKLVTTIGGRKRLSRSRLNGDTVERIIFVGFNLATVDLEILKTSMQTRQNFSLPALNGRNFGWENLSHNETTTQHKPNIRIADI